MTEQLNLAAIRDFVDRSQAEWGIKSAVLDLLDLAERQERQLETAVAVLREIGDKEVGWSLAWSRAHEALAAIEGKHHE